MKVKFSLVTANTSRIMSILSAKAVVILKQNDLEKIQYFRAITEITLLIVWSVSLILMDLA